MVFKIIDGKVYEELDNEVLNYKVECLREEIASEEEYVKELKVALSELEEIIKEINLPEEEPVLKETSKEERKLY